MLSHAVAGSLSSSIPAAVSPSLTPETNNTSREEMDCEGHMEVMEEEAVVVVMADLTKSVVPSRFRRVCVFCGSSQGKKKSYQDAAVELGKDLVRPSSFFLTLDPQETVVA
jgi:hypothetical protein